MKHNSLVICLVMTVAATQGGCSVPDPTGEPRMEPETTAIESFRLFSPAFDEGGVIPRRQALEKAMGGHILGEAVLMGRFSRP